MTEKLIYVTENIPHPFYKDQSVIFRGKMDVCDCPTTYVNTPTLRQTVQFSDVTAGGKHAYHWILNG
jgi:hypothetical protein